MQKLNIVADENILLLDEFFNDIANVTKVNGRTISAEQVAAADALVLRSTAQVNEGLLASSNVQFVGTCTIGIDHLDTAYMDAQGIRWTNAPGCNAEGVCDFAISAMNQAWQEHGVDPRSATIGVVGAGNVGGRLIKRLQAAGLKVICSDPPLQSKGSADYDFVPLETLLAEADIISLHTPLTKSGAHATHGMINASLIQNIKPGAVLISAGRGEVVQQNALLARLQAQGDMYVYLDVWETEPAVDTAIMAYCETVTPHIAGHSLEGKVRGTEMIYQALCQHFNLPITQTLEPLLPAPEVTAIDVSASEDISSVLHAACTCVYPLLEDDQRTREALNTSSDKVAEAFDLLRKTYPIRREFSTLNITGVEQEAERKLISGLGFKVN